jgi:hypothetical protein
MILQHNFITKSHDPIGLYDGVNKMSTLMNKIEKQSLIDPLRYDPDKYKGDALESFVEKFLKILDPAPQIGVYNYVPIQIDDVGADGEGTNIRGEKCVVQIKYRSKTDHLLTANGDHLANLISAGMLKGVYFDNNDPTNYRYFIFTTAKELHFVTNERQFEKNVYCFGYDEFRKMVDNNQPFWNKCREVVQTLHINRLQQLEVY